MRFSFSSFFAAFTALTSAAPVLPSQAIIGADNCSIHVPTFKKSDFGLSDKLLCLISTIMEHASSDNIMEQASSENIEIDGGVINIFISSILRGT